MEELAVFFYFCLPFISVTVNALEAGLVVGLFKSVGSVL